MMQLINLDYLYNRQYDEASKGLNPLAQSLSLSSNKEHDHKNKKSSRVVGDIHITKMIQKPFLGGIQSGKCILYTGYTGHYFTV